MKKGKLHISITLMLLAIVAIVAFQSYWIRKNFLEEKQNLTFRTNILFRDAVNQLQLEKLKLDSNIQIRFIEDDNKTTATFRTSAPRVMRDSLKRKRQVLNSIVISANKSRINAVEVYKDSVSYRDSGSKPRFSFIERPRMPGPGGNGIYHILRDVDSLQDSITVPELTKKYAAILKQEQLQLPFIISKYPGTFMAEREPPDFENANKVTLGYSKPVTYQMDLQNTTAYILKKLSSQLLVSVLLVALTIFSFSLLLRNLVQQRKLTQLKNDFISNITHELKTPIATVSVAVEAMRNFNALDDPNRTREYLDISANELQRLSLLVDKVLKLSMFEKQQIELREEQVDLKPLVEEVVASMRLQFEKYKAQVSVHAHGKNFTIKADRLHVTSVVYNLLDNALKYSKSNPAIQVDLNELPNDVEIGVTDNGIGISPEYQKKIFDKFFRVPTGDTHNVKGYGLGLSYVAYVVQRHNGNINMESQPGIGSRFTIKLQKNT